MNAKAFNGAWASGQKKAVKRVPALERKYEAVLRANARKARRSYEAVTAAAKPDPSDLIDEAALKMSITARTETERKRMAKAVATPLIGPAATPNFFEPVLRVIATTQAEAATKAVRDALVQVIADSLEGGWTVPETADKIEETLTDYASWEATRLARTDLVAISNATSFEAAKHLGDAAPPFKRWISAGDEKVRPTHQEANGQTVEIGKTFQVGGFPMDHPGDFIAPYAETMNCRCTQIYLDTADASLAHTFEGGIQDPLAVAAAGWDESKHPRHGKGEKGGGQFKIIGTHSGDLDPEQAKSRSELYLTPPGQIWDDEMGQSLVTYNAKNPLVLETGAQMKEWWDRVGYGEGDFHPVSTKRFADAAREAGYDAIVIRPGAVGMDEFGEFTDDDLAYEYGAGTFGEAQTILLYPEKAKIERGMTAAGWDESKHPRYERGTPVSGRAGGGRFAPASSLGIGDKLKLPGNMDPDGKTYEVEKITPIPNTPNSILKLTGEDGEARRIASTVTVEPVAKDPPPADVMPLDPADTEQIRVTAKTLKPGDRFFGIGDEYVVDAEQHGRYVRVTSVKTGAPAVVRGTSKVSVLASEFPAQARRLAKTNVSHVEGEYGKVFEKSPGPGTGVTKAVNVASVEAAKVVTLPDGMPKIELKTTTAQTFSGQFSSVRQGGHIKPLSISIRNEDPGTNMPSTVHHEFGHYIDASLQETNERGFPQFASERRHPEVAGPVMDAIDASAAGQRVAAVSEAPAGTYKIAGGYTIDGEFHDTSWNADRSHARYVAEPSEKFARAYEQYVSTKNGVRAERYAEGAALPIDDLRLDNGESMKSFYGWYWTPEDFQSISTEFDAMFARMGWSG